MSAGAFEVSQDSDEEYLPFKMVSSSSSTDDELIIPVILNNDLLVPFEFDTAAGDSLIPKSWLDYFEADRRPLLQQTTTKLKLADGKTCSVAEVIYADV